MSRHCIAVDQCNEQTSLEFLEELSKAHVNPGLKHESKLDRKRTVGKQTGGAGQVEESAWCLIFMDLVAS